MVLRKLETNILTSHSAAHTATDRSDTSFADWAWYCWRIPMDSHLERLQREIEEVLSGGSASDLNRSSEGKWTPAQILEHLLLTYKSTNRILEKCAQSDTPNVARRTLRDRVATLMVVNFGYIPSGRKAPERVIPRGMGVEEIRRSMADEIGKMRTGFQVCEDKFGAATRIMDHPVLGPLTAEEWRKFHWFHWRHHLRQIQQRMNAAGKIPV